MMSEKFTAHEAAIVHNALLSARFKLKRTIIRLKNKDRDITRYCFKHLGISTSRELLGFAVHLGKIYDYLCFSPIFKANATECGHNTPAYAYRNRLQYGIYLCPGFFNLNKGGPELQSGTLIHEASHAISGPGDDSHGIENDKKSRKNNDTHNPKANADTIEYFVEMFGRES